MTKLERLIWARNLPIWSYEEIQILDQLIFAYRMGHPNPALWGLQNHHLKDTVAGMFQRVRNY